MAGFHGFWNEVESSHSTDAPLRDPQHEERKEMESWVRSLPCQGPYTDLLISYIQGVLLSPSVTQLSEASDLALPLGR